MRIVFLAAAVAASVLTAAAQTPAPPPGIEAPPPNPDAASLFTVLQEQLGLKLESARLPMPVMVVDRVEPPVED